MVTCFPYQITLKSFVSQRIVDYWNTVIMASNASSEGNVYTNEEEVDAITKRSIGKLIVKYCGNEGQKDDETLAVTLRTLLQRTISKLDTESEETWKNAEIVIYDQEGNDFCIRSGKAENKFVVQLDGHDEVDITCTHRKSGCSLSSIWRYIWRN